MNRRNSLDSIPFEVPCARENDNFYSPSHDLGSTGVTLNSGVCVAHAFPECSFHQQGCAASLRAHSECGGERGGRGCG